jgi:hypothetical protein
MFLSVVLDVLYGTDINKLHSYSLYVEYDRRGCV